MSSLNAFAQSQFLKTVATLSSFVFVALLLINPGIFAGIVTRNEVNANFIANDYATTNVNDGYVIDPSLEDLDMLASVAEPVSTIQVHTVRSSDTLSTIAQSYGVSIQNIKTSNNLPTESEKYLKVGSQLYISPIAGVMYVPKETTSLMVFANMYNLDLASLKKANQKDDLDPIVNFAILIPNINLDKAYKIGLLSKPEVIKPVQVATTKKAVSNKRLVVSAPRTVAGVNRPSSFTSSSSNILASWRQNIPGDIAGMGDGYCTEYAAYKATFAFPIIKGNKRFRGIKGNAVNWLGYARSQWYITSKTPTNWSVGVMSDGGGGSSAWHVVIVEWVNREDHTIKVSDMNYQGMYIVTVRTIKMNDHMTQAADGKQKFIGFIPSQPLPPAQQEQFEAAKRAAQK